MTLDRKLFSHLIITIILIESAELYNLADLSTGRNIGTMQTPPRNLFCRKIKQERSYLLIQYLSYYFLLDLT